MKKEALILFLLIVLSGLANAQTQTLGGEDGYLPTTDIALIQICTNCTYVNITYIKDGSGGLISIEDSMTKDETFFNYTLNASSTSELGEYVVNWLADPDGIQTTGNYNFFVRKNATRLSTAESNLYIVLLIISILAFIFFLYFSMTLPYSDERSKKGTITRLISAKYLKLLSIILGYGSLIWFLNILVGVTENFISLEFASRMLVNLYVMIFYLSYPLVIVVFGLAMIEIYKDLFIPMIKWFLRKHVKKTI